MNIYGPCTPEDTRPLNIANTDNRLLSNAVRVRLEPILDKWISPMQQGFLPGRSLLSNVVDIDEGMMTTALCQEEGAALFFDFKAAFPSVLHSFLIEVLRHIGLPPPLMHFLAALYTNNICSLVLGGNRFPGFHLLSGIRQ